MNKWTLAAVALLFQGVFLYGQGYKATIVGRVVDPTQAVVPNAKVTAVNVDTGISTSTVTTTDGDYVVPQLQPGNYRLTIQSDGFETFVRPSIPLQVDQTVRVDAALTLGSVSEQVIVPAEAPVVDTDKSSLGMVVTNSEIMDIPLNGRNYLSLALLTPGVVPSSTATIQQGGNPQVFNGGRSDHVNYLVDGVPNIDRRGNESIVTPSIDSIQETNIITNNFSAVYGRLGSGVVSVALRSGTNAVHGSVYEFLRNDDLDARGFFDPSVPKLKRNQFGAALGGPIRRNRTFFFASYEGQRQNAEQTQIGRVPTLAERTGVFATTVNNPLTKQPFPNNTIPAENINTVSAKLAALYPAPNRAGTSNFLSTQSVVDNNNSYLVKIDHQLREIDRITATFVLNSPSGASPFRSTIIPGFGSTYSKFRQQWNVNHTHIFGATTFNEFRAVFSRSNSSDVSNTFGTNMSQDLGITGLPSGTGLAEISVTGYPNLGGPSFLPDKWTDNEYAMSDSATLVRGAHNLQFGGDYQHSQHYNLFAAYVGGLISFQGSMTGNAMGDLLVGFPLATQQQIGTNKSYLFSNSVGAYFQDDWKIHRRLTLSLGVRYDVNQPPSEKYDHWSNFMPSVGKPVVAGTPGYAGSLMQTDRNNVTPRFGFAYRPFGTGRTVLRGGYGVFSSFDLQYTLYTYLGANAYPFTKTVQFRPTAIGNLTMYAPFPNTPGTPTAATTPSGWDYANPTPYMQSWNLTLAQQLTRDMGIEVAYVGDKGTHESVSMNINQPIRTPQGNITPFVGYGRILYQDLDGNSSYNALQISLQRRFVGGLRFRSNFTWGKSIDTASFGQNSRQPQDSRNLAAERALGEANRGRAWTNDLIYQLPFGKGRRYGSAMKPLLDALMGGWQMSGIVAAYDGRPFTPTVAAADLLGGFASRPDRLASGTVANPTIGQWFDPKAFAVVPGANYRFGTSGRDILVGPGVFNIDLGLQKDFSLPWEKQRLQFRGEIFNLPNHANFGQPDARIDQPTAGTITSLGNGSTGRQIQLALKYLF